MLLDKEKEAILFLLMSNVINVFVYGYISRF